VPTEWPHLVVERITRSSSTGPLGIPTLSQNAFNDAVEGDAIVVAVPGEEDEVVNGDGGFLRVKLDGELATFLHLEGGGVASVGIDHHLRRRGVLFR
jgi:hypothetical protein